MKISNSQQKTSPLNKRMNRIMLGVSTSTRQQKRSAMVYFAVAAVAMMAFLGNMGSVFRTSTASSGIEAK